MADKRDTFEALVKSLADSERSEMLERVANVAELEVSASEQQAETASRKISQADTDRRKISLNDEVFLVRLWFKITAFFSSTTPEERYKSHLVAYLGKKLSQKYSAYILARKRMYTDSLYQGLAFLESVRSFFLPYINEYSKNRGDFYAIIASIIAPQSAESISAALDPFRESYETDTPKDVHAEFLREIDSAFYSFSEYEKDSMYQAARAAEWFLLFTSFSLNRIINHFSQATGKGQICPIDIISEDLKKLCSILTSAVKIPARLLEALFMFMEKDKIEDKSFEFDKECEKFVKTAANYLSGIISFKSRVPLADFVRFSCADILWEPDVEHRGQDWFRLFKLACKARFEKRFAEWTKLHDKYVLKNNALSFLKCTEFPELEYAPWKNSWIDFEFHGETAFLFLKGFFSNIYPNKISKLLKIIVSEGDFYRRENLAEFTDAFNTLEHSKQDIADFEICISPKGDLGEDFARAITEKTGTQAGKTLLENLMMTIETEASTLRSRILTALKSMAAVLGGILHLSHDEQYDTLSNLSAIYGSENEKFRAALSAARLQLQECANITTELSK